MKTDFDNFHDSIFFFKKNKYFFQLSFDEKSDLKNYLIYNRFNQKELKKEIFNCNSADLFYNNLFLRKFKREYNLRFKDFEKNFKEAANIKMKIENFHIHCANIGYRMFIEKHFEKQIKT